MVLLAEGTLAESLPATILHVPESVGNVFVADTSSARIRQYTNTGGSVRLSGESYFSIGENGVGKQRAWDRKTPLGIYFVTEELDTSRLHDKYGVMAFPLDYPNVLDRLAGRTGDGIWVHGVQPGVAQRPFRDTDGCIALPNTELAARQGDFVPGETPVVVTRKPRALDDERRERIVSRIMGELTTWRDTLAAADPAAHFALYSADFSYRGLSRSAWQRMRGKAMRVHGEKDIRISEPLILGDPERDGRYLVRFAISEAGANAPPLPKRLYWQRDPAGNLLIIAEDAG